MHYDITLRSLIGHGAPALLDSIAGVAAVELLSGEFPTARERRADVVARLADGRILHLELQTSVDPAMPWRMLEYHALIAGAHDGAILEQVVLHVGGRTGAVSGLERPGLSFHYRVVDIRDLDPAPLLASPALGDTVLAFLARCDDTGARVREILSRLATLSEPARRDAAAQLLILSGLRGAAAVVLKEIRTMPIRIEIEENPFLYEVFLKGLAEGKTEGEAHGEARGEARGKARALLRLIERRFGSSSVEQRERSLGTDLAMLEVWFDRAIDAPSLESVFSDPVPH